MSADGYGDNDTADGAYRLGTASGQLCNLLAGYGTADGESWFRVTSQTDRFTAQLRTNLAAGDLDLELFNSAGQPLGAERTAVNNPTLTVEGVRGQDLLIRVSTTADYLSNPFDLVWIGGDDPYENNDRRDNATVLAGNGGQLSAGAGLARATDVDYFRFDAVADGRFDLNVRTDSRDGLIDVRIISDASADGRNPAVELSDQRIHGCFRRSEHDLSRPTELSQQSAGLCRPDLLRSEPKAPEKIAATSMTSRGTSPPPRRSRRSTRESPSAVPPCRLRPTLSPA